MAQIAASTSGDTGPLVAESFVATVPAGTVDGDLLILIAAMGDTSTSITTPDGWGVVAAGLNTNSRLEAYKRVALSEPASYTVTAASGFTVWSMHRITGSPGIVDAQGINDYFPQGTQEIASPSIILSGAGLHLSVHAAALRDAVLATWTPPSDYTEVVDNITSNVTDYNATHMVAWKSVGPGATLDQKALLGTDQADSRGCAISIGILDNEQPGMSQGFAMVL